MQSARVVTRSPQSRSPRTLLQQLHWLSIKHCIDFKKCKHHFSYTLHFSKPAYLRLSLHACHSTRSLRLSNTNLLPVPFVCTSFGSRSFCVAALKSATLSLYLSVPVPVLTPFVVTSKPTTAIRPSNPLNPSLLAPQIQLLLTIVRVYKLYLLTYLLTPFTIHRLKDATDRYIFPANAVGN